MTTLAELMGGHESHPDLLLTENIGNLANLKVGKMINILRQKIYTSSHRRSGDYAEVSDAGRKFASAGTGYYSDSFIGAKSDIVSVGKVEDIGALRKAYKAHPSAQAFALYVNNVAIAFGVFDEYQLGHPTRKGMLAWDFSKLSADALSTKSTPSETDSAEFAANLLKIDRRHGGLNSYHEQPRRAWDKEGDVKKYTGKLILVGELKDFLDNVKELAGSNTVTCRLVLNDKDGTAKRHARIANPAPKVEDVRTCLADLRRRLEKYKFSKIKKDSAANIKEFIDTAMANGADIIQFDGRLFRSKPESSRTQTINPIKLLNGETFSIDYDAAERDTYDALKVYFVFNRTTSTIIPYKAVWNGIENGVKIKRTAALDLDTFMSREYASKSDDKTDHMTTLLKLVKSGHKASANEFIDTLRYNGIDYPEFEAVKKSLASL